MKNWKIELHHVGRAGERLERRTGTYQGMDADGADATRAAVQAFAGVVNLYDGDCIRVHKCEEVRS